MAQYTFEDILKSYVRKIGEEWGNTTESISDEMIPRLNETYWSLLRQTGASWQPPKLLTLTAVTAATNKHALTTALGISGGQEVLTLDEVSWDGVVLYLWDKAKIDEQYDYASGGVAGTPYAYAFWTEVDTSYIALYPFVDTADSTSCRVTWHKRPAKITSSNYISESPIFGDQYAMILAEEMAQDFLLNSADAKLNNLRLVKHENDKRKMTNHYLAMRAQFRDDAAIPGRIYFYGETP